MFYLVHTTLNVENSLKDGFLRSQKSINKIKNNNINNDSILDTDKYYSNLPYVYTILVKMDNIKKYSTSLGSSRTSMIFDISLLLDRIFTLNLEHYGYPTDNTYDGRKLNMNELMDILTDYYNQIEENKKLLPKYKLYNNRGTDHGEIIFKSKIDLKRYLLKIYIVLDEYYDDPYYYKNKNKRDEKLINIVDIVKKNYKNVDVVLFTFKNSGNYKLGF